MCKAPNGRLSGLEMLWKYWIEILTFCYVQPTEKSCSSKIGLKKTAYSLRTFPTLLKGLCHGGSMEPQKLDNSSTPGSLIVHRKGVPKS